MYLVVSFNFIPCLLRRLLWRLCACWRGEKQITSIHGSLLTSLWTSLSSEHSRPVFEWRTWPFLAAKSKPSRPPLLPGEEVYSASTFTTTRLAPWRLTPSPGSRAWRTSPFLTIKSKPLRPPLLQGWEVYSASTFTTTRSPLWTKKKIFTYIFCDFVSKSEKMSHNRTLFGEGWGRWAALVRCSVEGLYNRDHYICSPRGVGVECGRYLSYLYACFGSLCFGRYLSYLYACRYVLGEEQQHALDRNCLGPEPVSPLNRAKSGKIGHFQTFEVWTFVPAIFWFLVVYMIKMWSDRKKK